MNNNMPLYERNHITCQCGNTVQLKTKRCPECGGDVKDLIEELIQHITPEDLQ